MTSGQVRPHPAKPGYKNLKRRHIEATDEEINALVYELYGLTEEEVAIVGGRV